MPLHPLQEGGTKHTVVDCCVTALKWAFRAVGCHSCCSLCSDLQVLYCVVSCHSNEAFLFPMANNHLVVQEKEKECHIQPPIRVFSVYYLGER